MNWRGSLEGQISALVHALEQVSEDSIRTVIEVLQNCSGLRFFSGVGKNGHVAAKIASTFSSLGLPSIFVDPVHAVHGDMNLFSSSDVLVAISNSGSTEELLVFLRALRNIGFTNIIGMHSRQVCELEKISAHNLYVPLLTEADHLGLAPVASSTVFMSVLQAMAVHISSDRNFTRADFVRTHPGGALGKTVVEELE